MQRARLGDRYFYEHFPNADALVLAVADDARDRVLAAMVSAGVSARGTTEDRLAAALNAFLHAVSDDPNILRMVTTDTGAVPGLAERRYAVLRMIAELVIEHSPQPGRLTKTELRDAAHFAVGGVNMLIERWLEDRGGVSKS